ncbi:hypothetical protein PM035_03480 [Halorubrum ezzemoulense]|uniref:hypothetical protein n=1 Tax=Halorubrum ezzemoulense TaxID=337243 RepID=UPI0023312B25|nr:hypothetical protein [Halorubrum ezzemoulense]MDB2260004.1 hypothetical protein [Halorubrum ezzemoulense]MDB2266762.1 hypothetical protein [Halorubrum ezzemoulense]
MPECRALTAFLADTAGVVRSDERMILLFLLLLSIAALAVCLHYTTLVLEGLPEPIPTEPIGP